VKNNHLCQTVRPAGCRTTNV